MAPPSETPRSSTPLVLAALAAFDGGLAVYQWLELVAVRGGAKATCAINETINCTAVWNSAFAGRIHGLTGLPVAGMGLLWSLVALGVAFLAVRRQASGKSVEAHFAALKLWGALGVLSCLTFATASFTMKAVCLTCLGTYALTLGFGLVAALKLPGGFLPETSQWGKAAVPLLVFLVPVWALLLYPGSLTPKSSETKAVPQGDAAAAAYFEKLNAGEKEALAEARAAYLQSPTPDVSAFPPRVRLGSPKAPVVMVDFTDVLCPHCRVLVLGMDSIEKAVGPDAIALEPRYFPLDGECNPSVGRKSGDPVRCLGAKIQLCLENNPRFAEVRREIFERQNELSADVLWEIGTKAASRMELSACVASPQTQSKLEDDIRYALAYHIEGTPLVILNGHETLPVKDFIYGMALSKGDPNSPLFGTLPEPRPEPHR